MQSILKRVLLILVFSVTTSEAIAADYTDIWWNAAESGWGVNVVQSDASLFLSFFVYGPNGQPTWYSALLTQAASGIYSGDLIATTGTWFGQPWNAQQQTTTQVGTASFQPTSPYTATLIYALNGGPTVTKAIERFTLTTIALGGNYNGGQTGAYSGCSSSANNGSYIDRYDLQVTQPGDGSVTFQFNFTSGFSCTLSGTLEQHGQQYRIPGATYQCSDGLNTTATMSEIKATSLGIEGRFAAPSVGGGCQENANFAAVLE